MLFGKEGSKGMGYLQSQGVTYVIYLKPENARTLLKSGQLYGRGGMLGMHVEEDPLASQRERPTSLFRLEDYEFKLRPGSKSYGFQASSQLNE